MRGRTRRLYGGRGGPHGLLPICAWCKKVRNDSGSWEQIEVYVRDHTEASFSHGICLECRAKVERDIGASDHSGIKP